VAWQVGDALTLTPDPNAPMPRDGELIVIGSLAAESEFLEEFETV